MTRREAIHSDAAPKAIGPYSQAVRCGDLVFISGQIPLVPETMMLVEGDIKAQTQQVLDNLSAIIAECGAGTEHIAKLTVYLDNINNFAAVNDMMSEYLEEPYPARAAVQVAALPKGARLEIDAILSL